MPWNQAVLLVAAFTALICLAVLGNFADNLQANDSGYAKFLERTDEFCKDVR
jgi:hypothetical protein